MLRSSESLLILVVLIYIEKDNCVAGCGEVLTVPSGTFQSPRYPDADDKLTCRWEISMPRNGKLEVIFDDFDLLDIFCCTDQLELLDSGRSLGTFTGRALHGKTITSVGNEFTVVLKTCSPSFFFDRRGIKVSYTIVFPATSECLSTATLKTKRKRNLFSHRIATKKQPTTEIRPTWLSNNQLLHTATVPLEGVFPTEENGNNPSELYLHNGLPKHILRICSVGIVITAIVICGIVSKKGINRTFCRRQHDNVYQNDRKIDHYESDVGEIGISKDIGKNPTFGRYERSILSVGCEEKNDTLDYEVFELRIHGI